MCICQTVCGVAVRVTSRIVDASCRELTPVHKPAQIGLHVPIWLYARRAAKLRIQRRDVVHKHDRRRFCRLVELQIGARLAHGGAGISPQIGPPGTLWAIVAVVEQRELQDSALFALITFASCCA